LKPHSPSAAVSIHRSSCLIPPKGIFPPSGPGLTRLATVPHPAIGRLESSKTTPIARKAIASHPWEEREDSNGAPPSKTKMSEAV
jgi:hypothetical protein